jgi:prepilin peptidase CpaA
VTWGPHEMIAAAGLLVGALIDARTGRIPNALTGPMIAGGVIWWLVAAQPTLGLLGALAGFVVHFAGYKLGVEKAGDAKLFMGFGAWMGWWEMVEATLWTCVVYLPVALGVLLWRGRWSRLTATAHYLAARAQGVAAEKMPTPEQTMLRTGPIIAVGGWVAMATSLR